MSIQKLTIQVEIQSFDGDIHPDIARHIEDQFSWWNEGRYTFFTEMFVHALENIMNYAVEHATNDEMRKKFGNELVTQTYPNGVGQTARWLLEAQKATKIVPFVRPDSIKVSMTPGRKTVVDEDVTKLTIDDAL